MSNDRSFVRLALPAQIPTDNAVIVKDSLARRAPDAGALDRRLTLIGSYLEASAYSRIIDTVGSCDAENRVLQKSRDHRRILG